MKKTNRWTLALVVITIIILLATTTIGYRRGYEVGSTSALGSFDDDVYEAVYPIGDLSDEDGKHLMGAIKSTIAPEYWDSTGGLGSIAIEGDDLVVRQCEAAHQEVRDLLDTLVNDVACNSSIPKLLGHWAMTAL
jgi:hypothetical protein